MESANCVPYVLTCQRAMNANVSCMLTCSRVQMAFVTTC